MTQYIKSIGINGTTYNFVDNIRADYISGIGTSQNGFYIKYCNSRIAECGYKGSIATGTATDFSDTNHLLTYANEIYIPLPFLMLTPFCEINKRNTTTTGAATHFFTVHNDGSSSLYTNFPDVGTAYTPKGYVTSKNRYQSQSVTIHYMIHAVGGY